MSMYLLCLAVCSHWQVLRYLEMTVKETHLGVRQDLMSGAEALELLGKRTFFHSSFVKFHAPTGGHEPPSGF